MNDNHIISAELQGSFLLFIKTFFPILTGREFIISNPHGRESHFITIARELVKCANFQTKRLLINVPPGHGKSLMLSFWVAWTMAQHPDSKYLYISYSHTLAAAHTDVIRRIMMLPQYRSFFNVSLRSDSKAKDFFQTTSGGAVGAFGSSGAITGRDAGLPGLDRFSGALIIDDAHKPDEVHSDLVRDGVIKNYRETIQQRLRGINVPIIFLGQRLHEADLAAYLINGEDGHKWETVILKAIDVAGNALYPEILPLKDLEIKRERDIYVFASQYQQDPQPAGGALFKANYFAILEHDPKCFATFITADTAETSKSYNDATVFSFFGIYEIETFGKKIGEHGLHWIDCVELRIEPKDLKEEFLSFLVGCTRYSIPPQVAAIEKKSTGVTLISILQDLRGIQIRDIQRTKSSGSKTQRFLDIQPYVAAKRVSFTEGSKHINQCIAHMGKITANESHRFDDIADTLADGIRIALIDKMIINKNQSSTDYNKMAKELTSFSDRVDSLKKKAYGR